MALYPKKSVEDYLAGYTDPRGLYASPGHTTTTDSGTTPLPHPAGGMLYPSTAVPSGSWAAIEPIKPDTDILLSRLKAELSMNVANGNNDTELAQTYAKYFKQLAESIRKECSGERF